MKLKSKSEINNYDEKAKFLMENGWEISWDDDNWVKSNSRYKEANNGISTDAAFNLVKEEMRLYERNKRYLELKINGELNDYTDKEKLK